MVGRLEKETEEEYPIVKVSTHNRCDILIGEIICRETNCHTHCGWQGFLSSKVSYKTRLYDNKGLGRRFRRRRLFIFLQKSLKNKKNFHVKVFFGNPPMKCG